MRPKPFIAIPCNGQAPYVRDQTSDLVWHRCEMRTLYADTDRSQVVYHAHYLRYFEFGRASLMREAAYPYKEVEEDGFVYPIIKVDIDYFHPLYYDDLMYVHTRPAGLERVRLQFDYVITHGETGDIVCKGFTRHCAINASGTPVGIDPQNGAPMGHLPPVGRPVKIPIAIATPGYLMDHHFQGRPVLPAVEAMEALARTVKEAYPQLRIDHLTDVSFEKFLFLETDTERINAVAELEHLEDGSLRATLLTRTKSPKAAFTRTKTNVRLTFDPSSPPVRHWPPDTTAALNGICTSVSPEKIYKELVPFGPTFRNIQAPLYISPDGAIARIKTPRRKYHEPNGAGLLGSGYALDAAFHAACVWAQHYKGIVAFPVAVERRRMIHPTRAGTDYIGRVIPKTISDTRLTFDILLLDENGMTCETAEGVEMRDVSGGRLRPPGWIYGKIHTDPLRHLSNACQDMIVVELDAVAGFAHNALTPLEKQRYRKMGRRRRKSFVAARMALKKLYRRYRNDDSVTPADQIETVYKNSPLPCIGPKHSSELKYCSVSHDHRFAIAVVDSLAVGVDVEIISPKALKAKGIFMSSAEKKQTVASPMDDMAAAVHIWSIKEAAAKALGIDLADTWTQVQVTAVGENESLLNVEGKALTAQHATVDAHLFTLIKIK